MSMKRIQIAEDSMRPALVPGDEIVTTASRRAEIDDIVVFPHPTRSDFWLVKRVATPPNPIDDDSLWVLSDNIEAPTVDSRSFGPVPRSTASTHVHHLDATTFKEACHLLGTEDDNLGMALAQHGTPEFWARQPGLPTLVLLILEQQVSLESGAAVYRRLDEATGGVTAPSLLELGASGMREIGTTRQKASYLELLAETVSAGELDIDGLGGLPPLEARHQLLRLKGIGPWTADAYLLSALRLPDMWPVGDRALQVGASEVLGMSAIPDEDELEILGIPWKPIRAVAARIIWHAYLTRRDRVEPPDPTLRQTLA
jgi:DNA-3-methyladenine glycosylase II